MNYKEKQINSECIYKGKIITLLKDDVILCDGNNAIREVVKHNGGVCVAALTENDEIMFVRQYRYPYDEEILELPAGKRNTVDEDPLVCGKRELREETGVTAKNFIPLGELYPTPGYCGEIIWMYAATDLSFGECEFDVRLNRRFKYIMLRPAFQSLKCVEHFVDVTAQMNCAVGIEDGE